LLVFDLGYINFGLFAQLTLAHVTFVTRAKSNLAFQVERVLAQSSQVQDAIVWIGRGADRQQVRLISVLYQGTWQRYLTNERDPQRLPPAYAVALYWQRWRIDDGYNVVDWATSHLTLVGRTPSSDKEGRRYKVRPVAARNIQTVRQALIFVKPYPRFYTSGC